MDGELVATFDSDSYVFIKTGDNLSWYQSEGYCDAKSVILYNDALGLADPNKLYVPGGVEVTFTLVVNNDETLVLSYGETDRRDVGLLWLSTSTGIIIQFRDALTNDLIASAEAEDFGSTEADNVRYAIRKALDAIFSQY